MSDTDSDDDGSRQTSPVASGSRMPRLICFDLDYTLWPLWVDTHVSPPLKRKRDGDINKIYDKYGQEMCFYADVPGILVQLKDDPSVHVAVASRTSAPRAVEQALDQLLIPSGSPKESLIKAMSCFNTREIYPGSKLKHFKEIHRKTGIPYHEMVFYDDESRNREVASLGVTFVLVPEGVDRRIFEKGLADWRASQASKSGSPVFVERRGKRKDSKLKASETS